MCISTSTQENSEAEAQRPYFENHCPDGSAGWMPLSILPISPPLPLLTQEAPPDIHVDPSSTTGNGQITEKEAGPPATPGMAASTLKLWEIEHPTGPSCLIHILKQDKCQWPHSNCVHSLEQREVKMPSAFPCPSRLYIRLSNHPQGLTALFTI